MTLKPREKAMLKGIETLRDHELLALIIKTGSREHGVMKLSQMVLNKIGGYSNLDICDFHLLKSIKGIGTAKALQILAILEISKRKGNYETSYLKSPQTVWDMCDLKDKKDEYFQIIIYDQEGKVLRYKTLSKGIGSNVSVNKHDILQNYLAVQGKGMIIVHNHPSGVCEFSKEDIETTNHLRDYCSFMGIKLLDHVLITRDKHLSLGGFSRYNFLHI